MWCDLVNKVAASPDEKITCESIMDELIKSAEQKEPDDINELAEPNDSVINITEENSSTPP